MCIRDRCVCVCVCVCDRAARTCIFNGSAMDWTDSCNYCRCKNIISYTFTVKFLYLAEPGCNASQDNLSTAASAWHLGFICFVQRHAFNFKTSNRSLCCMSIPWQQPLVGDILAMPFRHFVPRIRLDSQIILSDRQTDRQTVEVFPSAVTLFCRERESKYIYTLQAFWHQRSNRPLRSAKSACQGIHISKAGLCPVL